MPGTLQITNGDAVQLRETGLQGEVLAWKDVLHEGPVPAGLTLEEMRPVRARFLAGLSGRLESEVLRDLEGRDEVLAAFHQQEEVVLWFEHDLYDQLQLIQVLDWFSRQDLRGTKLSLILVEQYLGQLRPEQLFSLYPTRHAVTAAEFQLAGRAWLAFCAPDPNYLAALLQEDTSALPYLHGAWLRHLEQFPSARNGLSRTERQILEIVQAGVSRVGAIFCADRDREERIFMGDLVFISYVRGLADARVPLLRIIQQQNPFWKTEVEITPSGRAVLAGASDHVRLNGIDRWLGGVHLRGGNVWRWDAERGSLRSIAD
jgi:hypothetical protein